MSTALTHLPADETEAAAEDGVVPDPETSTAPAPVPVAGSAPTPAQAPILATAPAPKALRKATPKAATKSAVVAAAKTSSGPAVIAAPKATATAKAKVTPKVTGAAKGKADATAPDTPGAPDAAPPADDKADLAALLAEPASPVWYRRRKLWAIAVVVLLLAAGGGWWMVDNAASAAPSYATQAVARGNLTLTVTANGTIQPTRSVNIGSELSGTVLTVNVDVNDQIKKGQVLVVLDPARQQDQILRAKATLAAAEAHVRQSNATVTEAQLVMARLNDVARLSGGKLPSRLELDTARAVLGRALGDQGGSRAGVADARAALSTEQINLSKSSISSPSDGVVLTRSVDPGNAVAASLQAVTLFTVAEDLARLRLWIYVDEADVSSVKTGQHATFTVSGYPGRKFPAQITRVGFGSTITDNVVTYLTYLDVDNTDLSLRPGMTATASITALQHNDVLLVPNTALRFTPTAAAPHAKKNSVLASLTPRIPGNRTRKSAATGASTASAKQVWVLPEGDEGTAVAVAVTAGISDGQMTEIIAGDLEVGMRVITEQKVAAK